MSFFENTRNPQGFGGMTFYNAELLRAFLTKAGFTDMQVDKNEKGWLCVKAHKGAAPKA